MRFRILNLTFCAFFPWAAAAQQLSVDNLSLGQSLAKAREALSGYAYHEETFDGAVYRTIAAKTGEALMLGFDQDKIVMISKTTRLDQNLTMKESELTQSMVEKHGSNAIPFAFSEEDPRFNALVWGDNLKEEAGNPFFCIIFQVQTRNYLSKIDVSRAFYAGRDNLWKIPFALQKQCPQANYSSGGQDGKGYQQPNAGQVRVVHWLTENGKLTTVQESLFDHTMNGTALSVDAGASPRTLRPSDAYSRIIDQGSRFPLF